MIGIVSLLLVLYMLLFFTRVASIILVYTGLPENVARFQSRSAVTGCGFTTAESEDITGNLVRRRVISYLMLAGNIGIIASISSLLLSFISVNHEHYAYEMTIRLTLLGGGLLVLWAASRQRWFEALTIRAFELVSHTRMELAAYHLNSLCHLSGGYRVGEVFVADNSRYAGMAVASARPFFANAQLLGIQRGVRTFVPMPAEDQVIQIGDALIFCGTHEDICAILRHGVDKIEENTPHQSPPDGAGERK